MKIEFKESEVIEMIKDHIQKKMSLEVETIEFESYRDYFCKVEIKKKEEAANTSLQPDY